MNEPWVRFEDEHLVAVDKPSGVNTHRADTHAQDGMYEWVAAQRPDCALSILHRLDKGTSGTLLFGKSTAANRSVGAQFEHRTVDKRYELLAHRDDARASALRCEEPITRTGRPSDGAKEAVTEFDLAASGPTLQRYDAHPHTGRTHQVRIHAQRLGMPILGDPDHGGACAPRPFLHAAELRLQHPDGSPLTIATDRPPSFDRAINDEVPAALVAVVAHEARSCLFDPDDTNAYLWADRHHDGYPDVRLERLGDVALAITYLADEAAAVPRSWIDAWNSTLPLDAVYEQRRPRGGGGAATRLSGSAGARFPVVELGLQYLIDLEASPTSTGLFLDQRETRRELKSSDLRGTTMLNAFAHTGSLSVAAAAAGAETLSLDLSRRYLDWASENLTLNDLDPTDHDFVFGDAIEWMERFAKKGRTFDLVVVDPPSSSTSRGRRGARWSVERDLDTLIALAVRLCAPGGRVYASTNLRRMTWPQFLTLVDQGLAAEGRRASVSTRTLPLDHRTGPGEPPYLKAAWLTLDGAD